MVVVERAEAEAAAARAEGEVEAGRGAVAGEEAGKVVERVERLQSPAAGVGWESRPVAGETA